MHSVSFQFISKFYFHFSIFCNVFKFQEHRHRATEYKNRKRRVLPVNYDETKRRKKTGKTNNNPPNVEVKLETMDVALHVMQTSINRLNERLGPEIISDDEESDAVATAEEPIQNAIQQNAGNEMPADAVDAANLQNDDHDFQAFAFEDDEFNAFNVSPTENTGKTAVHQLNVNRFKF